MTTFYVFMVLLLASVILEQVRRRKHLPKGTKWLPGPPGIAVLWLSILKLLTILLRLALHWTCMGYSSYSQLQEIQGMV